MKRRGRVCLGVRIQRVSSARVLKFHFTGVLIFPAVDLELSSFFSRLFRFCTLRVFSEARISILGPVPGVAMLIVTEGFKLRIRCLYLSVFQCFEVGSEGVAAEVAMLIIFRLKNSCPYRGGFLSFSEMCFSRG